MWLEFHAQDVEGSIQVLTELGVEVRMTVVADLGRAGVLTQEGEPVGAVVAAVVDGPTGWVPYERVPSVEAALREREGEVVVGTTPFPGGARALLREDGRWVGLLEATGDGGYAVDGLPNGWALRIEAGDAVRDALGAKEEAGGWRAGEVLFTG